MTGRGGFLRVFWRSPSGRLGVETGACVRSLSRLYQDHPGASVGDAALTFPGQVPGAHGARSGSENWRQDTRSLLFLHRDPHRSDDLVFVGPGSVQELGEQPTLPGSDCSTVHDDVELAVPPFLEFDRCRKPVLDQSGETRRLC